MCVLEFAYLTYRVVGGDVFAVFCDFNSESLYLYKASVFCFFYVVYKGFVDESVVFLLKEKSRKKFFIYVFKLF